MKKVPSIQASPRRKARETSFSSATGCHSPLTLDPWLCVPVFRQVCLYRMESLYFIFNASYQRINAAAIRFHERANPPLGENLNKISLVFVVISRPLTPCPRPPKAAFRPSFYALRAAFLTANSGRDCTLSLWIGAFFAFTNSDSAPLIFWYGGSPKKNMRPRMLLMRLGKIFCAIHGQLSIKA
jgi:hypothetical protein